MHSDSRPQMTTQLSTNYKLQLAGCRNYTMPRTFWFSIRHTTIILVDSNLNIIRGDLRHTDRSITVTNRDAFNIVESTIIQQPLSSTTSPGKVVSGTSRTLIYNGYIQRQPPWYLQIPPPRIMNMIQTQLQELQVRNKFRCAFKIGTYTCFSEMPSESNLPGTRGSRPVEMAASVHSTVSSSCTMAQVPILTSIPSDVDFKF